MKLAISLACLASLTAIGCGGDDGAEAFPTYQECFDDHTMGGEHLPVKESIVVCCIEHPIDGKTIVCGDTKADCINYLTANLNQTSASTTDVMEACSDYVAQKNM